MPSYLIKVSQPAAVAAKRVEESVRTIGSHFAAHAKWRQKDGVATGTLVVEADDRRWALTVVPPCMRASAHVDELEPLGVWAAFRALDEDLHYAIAA